MSRDIRKMRGRGRPTCPHEIATTAIDSLLSCVINYSIYL